MNPNFGWKYYYEPTPKNIRKWADGLLAISSFISTGAIINNYKWLGIVALLIGVLGKFLSNFFSNGDPL